MATYRLVHDSPEGWFGGVGAGGEGGHTPGPLSVNPRPCYCMYTVKSTAASVSVFSLGFVIRYFFPFLKSASISVFQNITIWLSVSVSVLPPHHAPLMYSTASSCNPTTNCSCVTRVEWHWLLLCSVCPPGETQRCIKCTGANELYCDSNGRIVSCKENVSSWDHNNHCHKRLLR